MADQQQPRKLHLSMEKYGTAVELTGSPDPRLARLAVVQLTEAMWLPASLSDAERIERVGGALAALKGLAPRDELEGMLAAQMVATHAAAMDCLGRAQDDGAPFAARDGQLRTAAKLLALYTQQAETLSRNRGRGAHNVTVEQVRVESGGQAIVGHVSRGGGGAL